MKSGGKKTQTNPTPRRLLHLLRKSPLNLTASPHHLKCAAIQDVQILLMHLISVALLAGNASVKHMLAQVSSVLIAHNHVKTLFLWKEPRGVNPD